MKKMFKKIKINQDNSNMSVQCNTKGKCEMRFTELCKTCKHNCGKQKDKNYYEPRLNSHFINNIYNFCSIIKENSCKLWRTLLVES